MWPGHHVTKNSCANWLGFSDQWNLSLAPVSHTQKLIPHPCCPTPWSLGLRHLKVTAWKLIERLLTPDRPMKLWLWPPSAYTGRSPTPRTVPLISLPISVADCSISSRLKTESLSLMHSPLRKGPAMHCSNQAVINPTQAAAGLIQPSNTSCFW